MYLKALEIQGFKSFADKTRLTFEPGMIAIVGPNGCGKSNVSDAIRWVLGEQRPSALRCSKMQDLIFNGTDARKPLGMVEVSLHFADCEAALGTAYSEVSIARRAYRSGENAYFLNKTPCRLKDIQRLFMGTGVGTTSYSVMAQGQIDAILSSRPEDRRAVFEEAAGVTKFKADRKEALRKIAQTEENLTRLTDILRELKRQGTLLQRQAEKAERARTLRTELRGVDLFLSKRRAAALEEAIASAGLAVAEASARILAIQDEAEAGARAIASANDRIQAGEERIAELSEASAASAARHSRAQEIIQSNVQRMAEYRAWAAGLEQEVAEARAQLERLRADPTLTPDLEAFEDEREALQGLLDDAQEAYDERRAAVEETRRALQAAREALAQCDRQQLVWQQALSRAEAEREARLMKQARLAAELDEARRLCAEREGVRAAAAEEASVHQATAEEAREALIALDEDRSFVADEVASAQARQEERRRQTAALEAQRELLSRPAPGEQPDAGARLLDPANPLGLLPGDVLGELADGFSVSAGARRAVEAVLAPWSRAVIVRSGGVARRLLGQLAEVAPEEGVQLLVAEGDAGGGEAPAGAWLLAEVQAKPGFEGVLRRLLGGIARVPTLPAAEAAWPAGARAVVTPAGELLWQSGDGARVAGGQAGDPVARRLLCDELSDRMAALAGEVAAEEVTLSAAQARFEALSAKLKDTQRTLEKARRLADQAAGALAAAERDAAAAAARVGAAESALEEMAAEQAHDSGEREQARAGLAGLIEVRERHTRESAEATERLDRKSVV